MNIFLTYSSLILGSWAESYPGSEIPPSIEGYNQASQYKITTAGNFYISHVTFITVSETNGQGGALYGNAAINLLIESSSFIQCHSSGEGGAIYFNNGKSFLKKVCSTSSYSSAASCHFCYISTKSLEQCTNSMEYKSVADLNAPTGKDNNVDLRGSDDVIVKYVNVSKSECADDSAINCSPSVNGYVSYSSFQNNTAKNYDVILFHNGNDVDTCNIIGNLNETPSSAIIFITGITKISNSCVVENKNPMFYFGGDNQKSCTITNCTIDNTEKGGSGEVIINNVPSNSFINSLDLNGCFSMNVPMTYFVCPTFNMKRYKCQMNEKRGFFIVAKF